eukprot:6361657-Amphidinium_carterae.1
MNRRVVGCTFHRPWFYLCPGAAQSTSGFPTHVTWRSEKAVDVYLGKLSHSCRTAVAAHGHQRPKTAGCVAASSPVIL